MLAHCQFAQDEQWIQWISSAKHKSLLVISTMFVFVLRSPLAQAVSVQALGN